MTNQRALRFKVNLTKEIGIIDCIDMVNLSEFMNEYQDQLYDLLREAKLNDIIELWLEFFQKYAMRAHSKMQDFDGLFGDY